MERKLLPLDVIKECLKDSDSDAQCVGMKACKGRDIPIETIKEWLEDDYWVFRCAAMEACKGRDVPLEVIMLGLEDDDQMVRCTAMEACVGQDVPLKVIKACLEDDDRMVRCAAMEACKGRDVPIELIKAGMEDDYWMVRDAAIMVCKSNGIPIPVTRSIEPPSLVYKRCLKGVIIAAEIPKDANVRGEIGGKCRSDKAIIKEVIGDFFGEKVGVSIRDNKILYYAGDIIEIEDFDYSDAECSTGFHFFCTIEEAKGYNG